MGTVTYEPTDPEAEMYEKIRQDNEAQTQRAKQGTATPLPDLKPKPKAQE